jgi:hypothetical protein
MKPPYSIAKLHDALAVAHDDARVHDLLVEEGEVGVRAEVRAMVMRKPDDPLPVRPEQRQDAPEDRRSQL